MALAISGSVLAQTQPEASIKNLGNNTIAIDGEYDGIWANVEAHAINTIYKGEIPTLQAAYQAVWDADGIYLLIAVQDDVWMPSWLAGAGSADWNSDQVELYFDASNPQKDGGGPAVAAQKAAGNHQFAPNFTQTSGELVIGNGIASAAAYDGQGNYIREYFISFDAITNGGVALDPAVMSTIGFDISISDRDKTNADGGGRNRMVWSNDGTVAESWANCDGVGLITFSAEEIEYEALETDFIAYMIPGQVTSTIHADVQHISVLMPAGTDLSALVPEFTLSDGAIAYIGMEQVTSTVTAVDFSEGGVIYSVWNGMDAKQWLVEVMTEPSEPVMVTFTLDASSQAVNADDIFLYESDVFYLTGSFNGWIKPGEPNSVMMTKGANNIYTATVELDSYKNYEYKYFLNAGWNGANSSNFPLTVEGVDKTVEDVWTAIKTSVKSQSLSLVSLYPNPVNAELTIANLDGVNKVVVSNIVGQTVITRNVTDATMKINTSEFKAGVYVVTLVSNDGSIRAERIVKE